MKFKIFTFSFFISLFSFSQLRIVDSITKNGIPYVSCVSEKGYMLGITDVDGYINFKNINNVEEKDIVEFSHMSFESVRLKFGELIDREKIEMKEKINLLEEVTVSLQKEQSDYLVIKGFFRTFQVTENIPVGFGDGLVEYYINLKKDKVYENLLYHRDYRHKNKDLWTKNIGLVSSGIYTGPIGIGSKTILDEQGGMQGTDNKIYKDGDFVGKIDTDEKANVVTAHYDLATESRPDNFSMFGFTSNITAMYIEEKYNIVNNIWNKKSHLLGRKEYRKTLLSKKKKGFTVYSREDYREFYVFDVYYISKKEFKNRNKRDNFGVKFDIEEREFLKEINNNIPEQAEYISRLLKNDFIEFSNR